MQIFYDVQGQLSPQSEVEINLINFYLRQNGCPSYLQEIEGVRVVTTLSINFYDAHWELTP